MRRHVITDNSKKFYTKTFILSRENYSTLLRSHVTLIVKHPKYTV